MIDGGTAVKWTAMVGKGVEVKEDSQSWYVNENGKNTTLWTGFTWQFRPQLGETPLINVPDLDEAMGQPLALKCESFQRTGRFKARGALNWLRSRSVSAFDRRYAIA